jgi:tetratricopeptide (TPR) repeat protein
MMRLRLLAWRAWASLWLLLGRRERAEAVFDRMVREFPGARYPLASRAHVHAQTRRFDAALADYEALLARHPDDASGWFNQGFVLESLGRDEDALASFRRATAIDPKLDRAWYGQGLVLIRLRRFDDAADALKRNTELQPMSPYGWYQLARVHVDRREPDEAVRIIRHLRGFEPKVAAQLERETGLLTGEPA